MKTTVAMAIFVVVDLSFRLRSAPPVDPDPVPFEAVVPTADVASGDIVEGTILVVIGGTGTSFLDSTRLGRCFEGIGEVHIANAIAINPGGGGAEQSGIGFGAGDGFALPKPGTRYTVLEVSAETCGEQVNASVRFDLTKVTVVEN